MFSCLYTVAYDNSLSITTHGSLPLSTNPILITILRAKCTYYTGYQHLCAPHFRWIISVYCTRGINSVFRRQQVSPLLSSTEGTIYHSEPISNKLYSAMYREYSTRCLSPSRAFLSWFGCGKYISRLCLSRSPSGLQNVPFEFNHKASSISRPVKLAATRRY